MQGYDAREKRPARSAAESGSETKLSAAEARSAAELSGGELQPMFNLFSVPEQFKDFYSVRQRIERREKLEPKEGDVYFAHRLDCLAALPQKEARSELVDVLEQMRAAAESGFDSTNVRRWYAGLLRQHDIEPC
ncbi:hypothetical protein GF351_01760 [Candidatus Woesearchaeota archaeon]|nr:hypothetical protein [Candidatus Woesearchaeota archaeon]